MPSRIEAVRSREECMLRAEECERKAEFIGDTITRKLLLETAATWRQLGESETNWQELPRSIAVGTKDEEQP